MKRKKNAHNGINGGNSDNQMSKDLKPAELCGPTTYGAQSAQTGAEAPFCLGADPAR